MGIFRIFGRGKSSAPYKVFDTVTIDRGNYNQFLKKFLGKSTISLIIGKRGAGKTALGMKMLETFNRKTNRPCYAVGFKSSKLPRWIKKADDLEDVPNNAVALFDEGAILFSSRDSMKDSNKHLSKVMAVARHKGLSLLLITQNCMPPETEIITENGIKKLGDLKDDELVFSYNLNNNKIELKRARISEPVKKKTITIETEDGDIIKCSPDHKLLVKSDDTVIRKHAKELTDKDKLLKPISLKEKFVKIKKITKSEDETEMIDINVDDNHNFILANGICVCNSGMIELNVLRLADTLILKEPSLLQSKFERKALKDMYDKIGPLFANIPVRERHFYVWDDDLEGMLSFDLPNFWSEGISKSFKDFK
ncbi:MAG: hypothetical protein ISS36_04475 [Candidatus Aenigmarchaeota archaeon]|nr:hypothetical protein [Candidatus Aenigmarchaeota archaeon]